MNPGGMVGNQYMKTVWQTGVNARSIVAPSQIPENPMNWQHRLSKRFPEEPEVDVDNGWQHIVEDLVRELDIIGVPWGLMACKERMGVLAFYPLFPRPTEEWRQRVADPACILTDLDELIVKFNQSGFDWLEAERTVMRTISAAVDRSSITCEACGARGSLDESQGWKRTLCESCKVCRTKAEFNKNWDELE